jgi:uncharacterized protein (DUF433 family)
MKSTERKLLKRIAVNPEIFAGKPIIRGVRISVELTVITQDTLDEVTVATR